MQNALAVGMGGFLGCIARYLVGVMVAHLVAAPVLPYATLLVNVVGCLLIGVLSTLAERPAGLSPPLHLFLSVGLLGGFTTYSTFGSQTVTLARTGQGCRRIGKGASTAIADDSPARCSLAGGGQQLRPQSMPLHNRVQGYHFTCLLGNTMRREGLYVRRKVCIQC